jgi:hypothetical protein
VSFAAITLCVASQRLFIVVVVVTIIIIIVIIIIIIIIIISLSAQSGNFWSHPHVVQIAF